MSTQHEITKRSTDIEKNTLQVNELDEDQFQNYVIIVFILLFTYPTGFTYCKHTIAYICFYSSFIYYCMDLKCVLNIQIDFQTICFNLGLAKNLLIQYWYNFGFKKLAFTVQLII